MKTIEITFEDNSNYFIKEAFNTLRTNVLFSGKNVKTIVVTSCFAHEGKSTVSFEMSRSLAEAGKQVLLIDADLRKSVMVSRHTKERGICGLSQLLSGQISMDKAIYHTQVEGLDIVFSGPYPPNPTELVGQAAFKEFLDANRDAYDYIIVDAPPLGLVIDAAVISSVCDGAILFINTGHVKYRFAQTVKDQLDKSGCKLLGVVLNQANKRRGSAGQSTMYKSKYAAYQSDAQAQQMRRAPMQQQSRPATTGTPQARPVPPTTAAQRPVAPGQRTMGTAQRPAGTAQQRPVAPQYPQQRPAAPRPPMPPKDEK
jgi:capsular exopolysaccharide synthesis family protein